MSFFSSNQILAHSIIGIKLFRQFHNGKMCHKEEIMVPKGHFTYLNIFDRVKVL